MFVKISFYFSNLSRSKNKIVCLLKEKIFLNLKGNAETQFALYYVGNAASHAKKQAPVPILFDLKTSTYGELQVIVLGLCDAPFAKPTTRRN